MVEEIYAFASTSRPSGDCVPARTVRQIPHISLPRQATPGGAAGFAYPQTGEGIRPAVESGLLAAKIIVAANGEYHTQRLEAYRARLLSKRHPWLMSAGRLIPSQFIGSLAQSFLKTHWFVRAHGGAHHNPLAAGRSANTCEPTAPVAPATKIVLDISRPTPLIPRR